MYYILTTRLVGILGIINMLLGFISKNHAYYIIGAALIVVSLALKFMPSIICFFLYIRDNKKSS
ncbi:hypothetical protein HYH96_17310 [Clostridium botulinum]|uniref:hypothetical protein n=1 Tax=Clostridium botulinum TaxID=1491 RepID=UPI0013C68CF3|nr:hypothetical protein [Clostridium botulinum]MBD5631163.1 hypothetical protein [Clostridium botulinum]MBD5645631.1 hypothetical protein [Clostridium botulinum]NFE18655.1 hypothetical protein [Clostridium botulinum]